MPENDINLIKRLLAQRIGANESSLGKNILMQHIHPRMRALGIHDVGEYATMLMESSKELEDFIEHFIVPETWFFREKFGLDYLAQYALKNFQESSKRKPFRILCLPCSTGEEAYSIAMALFEVGFSPSSFEIDAVDICKKSLIKAESLLFGSNSFRETDLTFQSRYFTKKACGYVLNDHVATPVHFMYGNIMDLSFPRGKKPYDFIVCRNLLIYLNDEAKRRAFELFDKLLTRNGLLILGQAEYDIIRAYPYVSMHPTQRIIYKRKGNKEDSLSFPAPPFLNKKEVPSSEKETPSQKENLKSHSQHMETASVDSLLSKAKQLADKGYLKEAEQLSLDYLSQHGLDSQVYFLLGTLQHAAGNDKQAEEFFEKTIYLNPSHYEALVYLSLLYQKHGEHQKAQLFRTRAEKASVGYHEKI